MQVVGTMTRECSYWHINLRMLMPRPWVLQPLPAFAVMRFALRTKRTTKLMPDVTLSPTAPRTLQQRPGLGRASEAYPRQDRGICMNRQCFSPWPCPAPMPFLRRISEHASSGSFDAYYPSDMMEEGWEAVGHIWWPSRADLQLSRHIKIA